MNCPVCGKPMFFNPRGAVGDPAEVCTVDDAAHRSAASAVAAERKALLAVAAANRAAQPDLETLAEIGKRTRPQEASP